MQPLVSILIPAHDAERWIGETIASALAQTWERTEIIVVDDGSRDQTLAVARRFASPRVAVVGQPHQGAAAARNAAFSRCQGDYVQWLDADDLLAPDKIARQMQAADGGRDDRRLFSGAWGHFIYRPQRARFIPTALWCNLSPREWLLRKLDANLFMPLHTWLVSRRLTEAAGAWDTRLSLDDDGEYFCRVLLAGEGTRFVPPARALYRRSGVASASSATRARRNLDSQLLSMELHVARLRALDDSERARAACLKYLQRWLIYVYPEHPDLVGRMERLADELGGRLTPPRLPPKYAWIQPIFGWAVAKHAWRWAPRLRASATRTWDRALSALERRHPPTTG